MMALCWALGLWLTASDSLLSDWRTSNDRADNDLSTDGGMRLTPVHTVRLSAQAQPRKKLLCLPYEDHDNRQGAVQCAKDIELLLRV